MSPQDSTASDPAFEKALAAHRDGRLAEAITAYAKILKTQPDRNDVLNNLGISLRQSGRFQAAETCYRRLIALAGSNAGLSVNLANCLRDQGKLDDALSFYRDAIDRDPDSDSAWHGLGLVERDLERLTGSLDAFGKALALSQNSDQYLWDRALSLLRAGRYRDGFKAYESRWTQANQNKIPSTAPEWDGSAFEGKTLLLYGEQGFGDVLQFARFIPQAVQSGGSVILVVRPELVSLLSGQFDGVRDVVSRDEAIPRHDLILPLLSLPRVLEIDGPGFSPTPYLRPKTREGALPARHSRSNIRVALAWAGSPTQKNDRNRSFSLMAMAPLLTKPNVEFFSVQKGPAAGQIIESGLAFAIHDTSPMLTDFSDTSALLAEMDLIISCDSAVVHLAGALGRPVWVALSVFHDWRYGLSGDLSPWYGSARVFKQSRPGEWADVFCRIGAALDEFEK